MPLACECDIYADGDWWYYPPIDFVQRHIAERRVRCYSCRELIQPLTDCGRFDRARTSTEMEELIHDEFEHALAPIWMCEECTGLYWSIAESGLCVYLDPAENMRDLAREVNAMRETCGK